MNCIIIQPVVTMLSFEFECIDFWNTVKGKKTGRQPVLEYYFEGEFYGLN